tara:strand:+ start:126091 stop:126531 length:441 start_codon:yes stop_codon:yes gene_type:complete
MGRTGKQGAHPRSNFYFLDFMILLFVFLRPVEVVRVLISLIRQRIKASMSFKPAGALDDKLGDAGQLYLDMIDFYKRGFKGGEWHFDPRAKGMEGDIKKWMSEGIDANREYFIKHLGLSDATDVEIDKAFDIMKDNLNKFIVIQEY